MNLDRTCHPRANRLMRWGHLTAIALTVASAASIAMAQPREYSMQDLQALERQSNWLELLQHANDIAPASRNDAWQGLVGRAARAYLAEVAQQEEPFIAFLTADGITRAFGFLRQDRAYMDERADVGIAGLRQCFEQSYRVSACADGVEDFQRGDPENHKLAFELATIMDQRSNNSTAPRLFQIAVQYGGVEYCQEESLQAAVVAGLSVPVEEVLEPAKDLAFGTCYGELQEKLVEELAATHGGYYARHSCAALIEKQALSPFQTAWCQDEIVENGQ